MKNTDRFLYKQLPDQTGRKHRGTVRINNFVIREKNYGEKLAI